MGKGMETKVCIKCGVEQPTTEFYADKRNKSGLQGRCRNCQKNGRKHYTTFIFVAMKICSVCKKDKPRTDFYKCSDTSTGLDSSCKECAKSREKSDKIQAYRKSPEAKRIKRERNFIKTYGITIEEYDRISELQGNKCLICGGNSWDGRHLAIDHNHKTGKIRGLLCSMCNRGLGMFKDSVLLLQKAEQYLTDNTEVK
jgi:hypothetical protein